MSALKVETPTLSEARAAIAEGRPVVIYGPECCGKTHNRDALREAIDAPRVLDPWSSQYVMASDPALHLCRIPTAERLQTMRGLGAFVASFDRVAGELGLEVWSLEKQAATHNAPSDILFGQLPNLPARDVRVSDPDPEPLAPELVTALAGPPSDLEALRDELRHALVARFRADLAAADFVGACELLAAISAQDDEDLERVKLALADWLPEGPA